VQLFPARVGDAVVRGESDRQPAPSLIPEHRRRREETMSYWIESTERGEDAFEAIMGRESAQVYS
jgi:hypothetical protein